MDNQEWKFADTNVQENTSMEFPDRSNSCGIKKEKKDLLITTFVISAVLLCLSIALSILLVDKSNTIKELQATIENQSEMIGIYEEMEPLYDEIKRRYEFFDTWACIVNDNSKYYHHYECSHYDDSSFYIFNIDYAKYKGSEPCPYCWK